MADRDSPPAGWLDLTLTVIMALAAVGTAWAGFQSAKWGGVQANSYAAAGAARTESNRKSTEAGQVQNRDLIAFTSWLDALNEEIIAGTTVRPTGGYQPNPKALSGFLFERLRPGFRPAVDAWIASHPLVNADAPATPFDLPEYQPDASGQAVRLAADADALAARARTANQRSDNYVLTAVIFALVLFFAGVAGRARRRRTQWTLLGLAATALLAALAVLASFPVEI